MLWLALRKAWTRQPFMRENYQGASIPTAAGIVLCATLVLAEAVRAIAGAAGVGDGADLTAVRAAVLVAVVGFSLFGLLDDLTGSGPAKGLSGHLRALGKGEITTGALKLFGGIVVSLVAVALMAGDGFGQLLIDGAVIALAANIANLFDVRPGRTAKVSLLAFLVLAVATAFDTALVPVAIVAGAAGALMFEDLRERLMLGDTGANALGAAIGVGMVATLGTTGRFWAAGGLLFFNLLSEVVSFSKLIDRIAPLRSLDQMGRRPAVVDVREKTEPTLPPDEVPPTARQPMAPAGAKLGDAHIGKSGPARSPNREGKPSSPFEDPSASFKDKPLREPSPSFGEQAPPLRRESSNISEQLGFDPDDRRSSYYSDED